MNDFEQQKRQLSAYNIFVKEIHNSSKIKKLKTFAERSREVAKIWGLLSAEEKNRYTQKAKTYAENVNRENPYLSVQNLFGG